MARHRQVRKLLKGVFALAVVALLGLAGMLALLLIEHNTALSLPAPTGPLVVGRVTETWTDTHRADPLVPDRPTELVVWIWYPSTASPDQKPAEYLPADWRRALAEHQGALLSTLLTRDPSLVQTHSLMEGPLSPDESRYPVVILRPGLGALTTQYTTLAEDLASHGYVVVGFDAPYRTVLVVYPDGRVVTRPPSLDPETLAQDEQVRLATRLLAAWVSDIGFVLDRLEQVNASAAGLFGSRLDLQKVAVVGHSLGGASAAQFCHDDARCVAGVDMDGVLLGSVVREGLRKPFMFLLSDHGEAPDPANRQIVSDLQSVYDRLPPDTRMAYTIRGANHFSFSDDLFVRPEALVRMLRVAGFLDLEPRRGLAISAEAVRRFLDVHLHGAPVDALQALPGTYAEVQRGLR